MRRGLILLALLGACTRDRRTEAERTIDAAYAVYAAVADALVDDADCPTAVAHATRLVADGGDALTMAFALQADPARLAAARAALAAREARYDAIAARLEVGFARCDGTPGFEQVREALDPASDAAE